MAKNVTIKDIAAEAGVSVSLVSFVMNNKVGPDGKRRYRVSNETRDRILEISRRLNYQPNLAARALRSGRTKVIGAVLPEISNVFYGKISKNLEAISMREGYTILIGSSDELKENQERIIRSFMDKGVEGFIVVPSEGSEDSINQILSHSIPCVFLDRQDMDVPVPKVVLDNREAMAKGVETLHRDRGVRSIEMISYTFNYSSMVEREEGYKAKMEELGLGEFVKVHHVDFGNIDKEVMDLMPDFLERKVEGLVFATNSLTIAALKAMAEHGVTVQKDLFVMGFDNSDVYEVFRPVIPHVQQPLDEICEKAMDILLGIISGKREQASEVITVEGKVVS